MMSEFWQNRSVLVTGAGGFTGSHLANRLIEMGATVRGFVRAGGNRRNLNTGIEMFEGDLACEADCIAAMKGIDTVFHVAAVFRTVKGGRSALEAIHVRATEYLMRAANSEGVRRFVHTSTMGVHGHVEQGPGDEKTPFAPCDDYQETKVEGEELARRLSRELNLPLVVIRPCGIYGPEDTRFLKMIKPISKRRFIMIGSGEVHYHFVYISDLVKGYVLAGEKDNAVGEVFLIGGKDRPTLNELGVIIARVLQVPPPILKVPVWPIYWLGWLCEILCDVIGVEPPLHPRRVGFFTKNRDFTIAKAEALLDYHPDVGIEDGMRNTIEWSEKNNFL